MDLMAIANSWQLWIACGLLVGLVLIQSVLYIRLCYKEADAIGFPKKKLSSAVRTGAITAIGPALAGVVVMVSMMTAVGGPITWQRLSIIGAAQTELAVANMATNAMGVPFGPDMGMAALTLAFLLMAINGCGWLLMVFLTCSSMEKVRYKLAGGDEKWLPLLSSGATIGMFANLTAQRILGGTGALAAVVVGYVAQYVLDNFVAPKASWVKSYSLSISLILGMIVGAVVQPTSI